MENDKLTEEEIHKFLNACQDFMRLGVTFTTNIRVALGDLRKIYDPVLKSNYMDKAVVELLTRSLNEFERKTDSNLEGIHKICTKGCQWFTFYLGKALGSEGSLHHGSSLLTEQMKTSITPGENRAGQEQAKKIGV
jgi:hypothetical protein